MKKNATFFLLFVLLLNASNLFSQISQGGVPLSFTLKSDLSSEIDNVFINPPDMEAVREFHDYLEKNGEMYRVAEPIDVSISMENSGTWDVLEDGTKIWRLRITSEDAEALSLLYDQFYLPEGSQLFIYNENHAQVAGAFTSVNNPISPNRYSTQIIQGETTTLEYIEPAYVTETPRLEIYTISYIYRGVDALVGYYKQSRPTGFGNSGDCEVNVNCPEGDNWQDDKSGVALIYIPDPGGLCTGSLVNNTNEDGTPYFLTADHCGGDQNDQDTWQFYFNFESPDCADPGTEPAHDDIIGANKIARGPESGGSDFLLLELLTTPPVDYGVYYNGWDRTDVPITNGIGIHHPAGDIMKISRSGSTSVTTWTGGMTDAHWEVTWQSTVTDWGVTEGGSSGSPLFDETTKRIVGTLTGGGASCSNQSSPDDYGRFDIHWEDNGSTDADQLAPWLDPTNSNAMSVDGYDPAAASNLTADFEASQTNIMPGTSINFTDLSIGDPTSWSWTFDGASPGTSSDQNPTGINYATNGTYDVTLEISDGTDNDTEIKTGYIIVEDTPTELAAAFEPSENVLAQGECINFQDQSTGDPTGWTWTFDGGTPGTSDQQNPTNICFNTPGVYDVTLEIENGTDTDSYTYVDCITVLDPATDPICAFMANTTVVPVGGVVTFTDTSVNGPYVAWAWAFEGGIPATNEQETPPPVAYLNVGTYDVELRVEHENGNQYICTKEDYITVVPDAIEPPETNFIANYTVIAPGEAVDFMDISGNAPYQWEWWFEGGFPEISTDQNPSNILYANDGEYDVRLIARNSEGNDTLVKADYIIVSVDDPCIENGDIPFAAYTATNRLLSAGQRTYFEDLSTNYPSTWNWYFDGGNPVTSTMGSPLGGIEYNIPGIYDVTLSVSNSCGVDLLTKDEYIYVFSGTVYQYCDTLTNVRGGEIPAKMNTPGTWGFIAGHNGERIRYYADKFNDYTFSQIEGLIVPVNNSVYGEYDSYVTFYIWEGSTEYPDSILAEKRVNIRDMPENFNSVVEFDSPVLVDGPFYVGFKLNYPDENGDGISDDYFVVSVAGNRGPVESQNTMYVEKSSTWYSSVEYFNIATSLAIKPVACLVDISEFDIQKDVHTYPNPTSDIMTVELGDEYFGQEVEIQVYDLTGRQISLDIQDLYSNEYQLNFKDQTSGIYFIKIQIGDEMITKKISVIR
ncbi:MAG: PKD domain-containing protein [Bacteroidota bacterium]|nr:PKD domain-containing protein [Bacteroidota bacterium]